MVRRSARPVQFLPTFMSMSPHAPPSPDDTPARSAEGRPDERELILYATPGDELGTACELFFQELASSGRATTAQHYPPHVTLTGFFRRPPSSVERVAAEVSASIAATPASAVVVRSLLGRDDWIGLEIESEWFLGVAQAFASRHVVQPGDDPIRLKTWLHLSLAYGDQPQGHKTEDYLEHAKAAINPDAPATWSIGLWERIGREWIEHRPIT